jgi:monoamine oxidase
MGRAACVIGAGVAGLAAAADLAARGVRVVVLEARDRIGGRIDTRREPGVPIPIELGAEFLHGAAPETTAIVDAAGLTTIEVTGEQWGRIRGRLQRLDGFWDRVGEVMSHINPKHTPDRSFADFLAARPGGQRLAEARRIARRFVEGFQAADATRISTRALAQGANTDESRARRLVAGYDRIPVFLARGLSDRIQLQAIAARVEWRPGHVRVVARRLGPRSENLTVTARAAIVTVPIGVLQAQPPATGAIVFDPDVPAIRRAVSGLTMGPAVRAVCVFRDPFWRGPLRALPPGAALTHASFLHGPDSPFPVWWTTYPLHAPMLTGWSGGPRAAALLAGGLDAVERAAPAALAGLLGVSPRRVARAVRRCWSYDWERDPFARGAYSYALVGGAGAFRALARPVAGTLFFAGEATLDDGRNGTVDGAIASGQRAAARVARHAHR